MPLQWRNQVLAEFGGKCRKVMLGVCPFSSVTNSGRVWRKGPEGTVSVLLTPPAPRLSSLISDILHLCSPARPLLSGFDTRLLKHSLYKFKTKGDRAFSRFGPSVWSSLPSHIRNAAAITTFKSALKTHFGFQPVSL